MNIVTLNLIYNYLKGRLFIFSKAILRYALLGFCLFAFSHPTMASDYFLLTEIGSSAETIGKGGVEGFNHGSSTIFENPAGLYRTDNLSMSIFTTNFMGEITYNNIALAGKTAWGNVGIGYMEYASYNIPYTGKNDQNIHFVKDYFDARSSNTKFSYQFSYSKQIHIGTNVNLYNTQAHDLNGSGFDMDLGVIFKDSDLEYSVFARNLKPFNQITYSNGSTEALPFQLFGGVRYSFYDFDFFGQVSLRDHHCLPAIGLAYNPFSNSIFHITSGIKSVINGYKNLVFNYNVGLLLSLSEIHFSYALEKSEFYQQDFNHFFSVGIRY